MLAMTTHRISNKFNRLAAIALTAAAAFAAGMTAPAPSHAADLVSSSGFWVPSCCPWVCYSKLAGYKAFQYSTCTGMSGPARKIY
jgi:hypothetical protein